MSKLPLGNGTPVEFMKQNWIIYCCSTTNVLNMFFYDFEFTATWLAAALWLLTCSRIQSAAVSQHSECSCKSRLWVRLQVKTLSARARTVAPAAEVLCACCVCVCVCVCVRDGCVCCVRDGCVCCVRACMRVCARARGCGCVWGGT